MVLKAAEPIEEQGRLLAEILKRMPAPDQISLWRYAAGYAKRLAHRGREHAALCLAIKSIDRGTSRSGPLGSSLIGVPRALSAEELQRAILRLKDRLLDAPAGVTFVAGQFGAWVQANQRELLVAVLDKFNCPHDERGFRTGPVPSYSAQQAETAIAELRAQYSAHSLGIVFGALIVDGLPRLAIWSGLLPAYNALWASAMQEPLVQPAPSESNRSMERSDASPSILAGVLQSDTATLELHGRHSGQPDASALEAALPDWLALVENCEAVRHISDAHFAALDSVVRVCAELRLARANDILPDDARLVGLRALEKCIDLGSNLDDMESDRVHDEISMAFGPILAIAAVRGRLRWGTIPTTAAAPPDPATESATPASPTVSTYFAGESTAVLMADPVIEAGDMTWGEPIGQAAHLTQPLVDASDPVEPARLRFFKDDFEREFWINEAGAVRPAPWRQQEHALQVTAAALAQWESGNYGIAFLHAKCLVQLGADTPFCYEDLCDAEALFSQPSSLQAGLNHERIIRLKRAISGPGADGGLGLRIATALEAVRPTQPCMLSDPEIERLIDMAGFKNLALASVISWILRAWAAGANPLPQLRENMSASVPEDLQALQESLRQAEIAFKDTVATLWSAAGGRLRHTHSRRAWSRFIQDHVVPIRTDFGNISKSVRLQTTDLSNRIRSSATRLAQQYIAIMVEVKYQDKVAADSAGKQIFEKLLLLADVVDRIGAQKIRLKQAFDACPQEDLLRLLNENAPDATEQLCKSILISVLQPEYDDNPLRIASTVLLAVPDAVKYLTPEAVVALTHDNARICIGGFAHPLAASTLLLVAPSHPSRSDDILNDVRELAIERDRRDILSALSPANVLASHERTLLIKSALDASERLFSSLRELENLNAICDMLMVDDEPILLRIIDEATSRVTHSDSINSLIDGQLLEGWLANNIAAAKRSVAIAEQLHVKIGWTRSATVGAGVEEFLERGKYQDAVTLLHGDLSSLIDSPGMKLRETVWRTDALRKFPEPLVALQTILNVGDRAQVELAAGWVSAARDFEQRDLARRALYSFVSREDEGSGRSVVLRKDLREHFQRKTVIEGAVLREYFQKAGLNPTFLPQLADIGKIILTSAGGASIRPEAALEEYARLATAEQANSLIVFIEPGLSLVRRDELCDGLRRRRLLAAVVDDVDLCRLCDARRADSPVFIALIEIVLEQLDLPRISPFSTQDGQHVRIESYVGRASEAEDLALRNKYTRVFSGRKLGKSALLKYVARKYNGHELISGNVLRVIFITIAGGESEQWVVQCIIDEMIKVFGIDDEPVQDGQRQRDRLSAFMHRFLQSQPKASVLLVLDEADTFVEGQLANYDSDREASLSFCLLKELPAHVDGNEMPRIRTIFSGYRVTNTRDGVWANAGDVLVLHPLYENEAVEFITGTLARVGVDIGEHAAYVARRCGRQPAVLIRFGECLLKHLNRVGTNARRETIVVSEATISAALTDQGVHDEIRTVVANNFQGHRVGQVIFNATLMALKELAPGQALDDAPSQILGKLRAIDSDFGWLERMNASPLAVVERNLQEFIERELLAMHEATRFGVREYRLKFPHFLPVLTQSETALETQQLIAAIRTSSKQPLLNRCALSDTSLENLRFWYREKSAQNCQLVVVGGQWIDALVHDKCGLPDRLGCPAGEVVFQPETADLERLIGEGRRVFVQPALDAWPVLLALGVARPIVVIGDVSWLRQALRYALEGGEVPVEVIAQGRLSESTVGWWIESARALHLEAASSVQTINRMTEGIPLLLGAFDRVLEGSPADELRTTTVLQAQMEYERELRALALALVDESFPGHLTTRERELLSMAVHVSNELQGEEFDLETEFDLYWEMCPDTLPSSGPPLTRREDRLALQLLVSCGLLPVADEGAMGSQSGLGRARIKPDGPLARLVTAMNAVHAR